MRYILTFLMASAIAFGLACQTASSSSSTSDPKKENPSSAEKAKKEKPVNDSHDEHNDGEAPRISLAEAKKYFDKGNTVFIDTRGKASFDNEHIKGAINVPMREFDKTYKNVPKNKKIIAYCS